MSAVNAMEDALGVEVRRADPAAAPPPLLRRVDREPRPPRLHAPRARLPRLRRARSRWRAITARWSSAACELKKAGQRDHARGRRPRDPPDQRPGGRLLPGARAAELEALVRALERARESALEAVALDRRARFPGLRAGLRVRRAARSRRIRDRGRAARARAPASTSARASTTSTSPSSTSRTPPRSSPACATAAPTSSVRWPATRSTTSSSRRWRARRPRRRGWAPSAATRSSASSCAPSS